MPSFRKSAISATLFQTGSRISKPGGHSNLFNAPQPRSRLYTRWTPIGSSKRKFVPAKMPTFPRSTDIATTKYFVDIAIYWIFRSAYSHDIKFFNNKLDTDSNPVAYSKFPGGYACRMSGTQASIISKQFQRCERENHERVSRPPSFTTMVLRIYRHLSFHRCGWMAHIYIATI